MNEHHPPILLVLGTTASGKSELSLQLAERLPSGGEIVSADSMQVWRGLDIGTAKPSAEDRARTPHHLIDLVDPHDLESRFNVAEWLAAAESTIAAIETRGRVPIVVGGTHLYVQALLAGLFEGPSADPALRRAIEREPTESLREELVRVDPESAARIHSADRRRTLRAVEVFRATGRPISQWQAQWESEGTALSRRIRIVAIDRPLDVANARINRRTKAMIEAGWLEEVRGLVEAGPLHRQAAEAVGYRQLAEVLAGRMRLADAVEEIKIRTRRYAKQQRTWLKRFRARPGSILVEAGDAPATDRLPEIVARLEQAPLG
ncbi:MAG: tRNA (adenosine(37)-N6)-dimethylallyltransferase MiaA [Phycisphaerales bacterium]